ncbi:contact site B protein [Dictyostelium discoideum AX4]|uniref:Glycoprotein 24B n=1 Tax=Dictyostelium discoideum TaxID=44689 RepID=CSBB_DICDI|nr:contact site B protein [Dictyostelium discoideum AX4]P16643.1 RecName: Full=Glycoprotein 24B; Short=gp24B; AltName: Full=Contact site B protein B [Dictyostelium discoideum]AAA33210.1 CsbB [Dictyostelium discoideum]EAL70918.1 contact site B protein [Dictyostelium discoideum AX4]|eukprot:XP_644942.1 contact site B protein [Dictyostelium discoideum AX4]
MTDLKITLVNEDGESTISGKGHPLPAPLIFPPIYCFCFIQYKTEGKLWDKNDFQIKSGKIEFGGEEYDITESKGTWSKDDEENHIKVSLHLIVPPKKIFQKNF